MKKNVEILRSLVCYLEYYYFVSPFTIKFLWGQSCCNAWGFFLLRSEYRKSLDKTNALIAETVAKL